MSYLAGFGRPFWLDFNRPHFQPLDRNLTTDIAIVGAGISGLKLAHSLSKRGISSVILEGARVGEGASGRNQGTICSGANSLYDDTIELFRPVCGTESRWFARVLWQLGVENLRLMGNEIAELDIHCDFQKEGFCSLARRDVEGFEALLQEYRTDVKLLQEDGFQVEWMDEKEAAERGGSSLYAGGMCYTADGQFHPGKFVVGLAQAVGRSHRVRLFEQTRVLRIENGTTSVAIVTPHGTVSAQRVFLLTNALVPQHVPLLAGGMRAERGQVFVTEPLTQRPCVGSFGTAMAWWREILEADGRFRLLFGGGRRRDEPDSLFRQFDGQGKPHPKLESEGFSPSVAHQQRLDAEFRKLFPLLASARITHRWGGLQCFTADALPMIGVFDADRRIHGMAGFSGRGNTYSNVGAEFLAARVAGVTCAIDKRYGGLIDRLLTVNRVSAKWDSWETSNE